MAILKMFARFFQIEQVKASKKSLVGAVYEHEREKAETESVPGDLKKYLNWNKSSSSRPLARQVCKFPHFAFLFIL